MTPAEREEEKEESKAGSIEPLLSGAFNWARNHALIQSVLFRETEKMQPTIVDPASMRAVPINRVAFVSDAGSIVLLREHLDRPTVDERNDLGLVRVGRLILARGRHLVARIGAAGSTAGTLQGL